MEYQLVSLSSFDKHYHHHRQCHYNYQYHHYIHASAAALTQIPIPLSLSLCIVQKWRQDNNEVHINQLLNNNSITTTITSDMMIMAVEPESEDVSLYNINSHMDDRFEAELTTMSNNNNTCSVDKDNSNSIIIDGDLDKDIYAKIDLDYNNYMKEKVSHCNA